MTKPTGIGRGGERAGAGRKAKDGATDLVTVKVALDVESLGMLPEQDVSLHLRALLKELREYRSGSMVAVSPTLKPVSKPSARKPFIPEIATGLAEDGRKLNFTAAMRQESEVAARNAAALKKYNAAE